MYAGCVRPLFTNNNNNNQDDIYGAFIVLQALRVHRVDLVNADSSARWLPAPRPSQPTLAVSPPLGCYHPHPLSPFYYYSVRKLIVILSFHGGEGEGRSRPMHCRKGAAARPVNCISQLN